jgi:PhnB protein
MKTIPYLSFDGNCREAFRFYAELLRGEVQAMISHGDSPIASEVPAEWQDRIMHAYLVADEVVLMGGDVPSGTEHHPSGFSVSLHVDRAEDAERIWAALLEGGQVRMPLEQTFWAERFGMLVDRFGTPWMIGCTGDAAQGQEPAGAGAQAKK